MTSFRAGALLLFAIVLTGAIPRARQVSAGPTDHVVAVGGLRLHYVDWGSPDQPPLVMVHGLDRVARTFDHLAAHFDARYRVIALDMRGHGDSGWDPQGRYRVEDHVGDLEGLVAQLGLRGITLWGNSTGGRVVQVFAGLHPDLVSRVIVEDVGPERPRQIADSYRQRVAREDQGWTSEADLRAELGKANPTMSAAVLDAYVRYGSRRRDDGRIVWKRDPALVNGFVATDLWRFIDNIRAPILYILGGRSTIVPASTQALLRDRLPAAQIVTLPGLGHYPSDEEPAQVLALADRFLAGLPIEN